jgi:hypothetical protein
MTIWASAVYLLCLLTSAICAWLLMRSYVRHRTRMLLWSSACFGLLAVNNLIMVLDILVFPETDLSIYRTIASLAAVATLLYGFIWEID